MEPSPTTSTTQDEATNYNDPSPVSPTPSTPASSSSSSATTQQQLSTMSIGIIILCILLGLALFVLLLLLMRRRRLQRDEKAQQQEQQQQQQQQQNHQQPKGGGFKQRMKERLPWHHHAVAADEEQRIDDLVFSAIQQHPVPPSHPYHRPHHYHLHQHHHHHHHQHESGKAVNGQLQQQQGSTMFEEGYSCTQSSTLRGTMTRTSHCSSSVAPPVDTDPVLASLARQHEFDRAGYYKNPNAVSDRDEEEAMLQRLSMSSYHVW